MTDPGDSSNGDLNEFIAAEKAWPDPSAEVQTRVFARLSGTLGLAPAPVEGSTSGTKPDPALPPPPAGGGVLAHVVGRMFRRGIATFLLGAAVGATAVGTVDRMQSKSVKKALSSSPLAAATPSATPAPAAPMPAPESIPAPTLVPPTSSPTRIRVAPESVAAEPRDKRLEAERKLVEMARTALARGQKDSALAALRRHVRWFPDGQLAEERDGLWVSALVARGDYAQAREHAARFHRQYPHSLFAPVVEQSLKSIP